MWKVDFVTQSHQESQLSWAGDEWLLEETSLEAKSKLFHEAVCSFAFLTN